MRYLSTIRVNCDPSIISSVFEPEEPGAGRASWRLSEKKDFAEFTIDAEDSVSLRAALNSITKSLTVIEKMQRW